MHQLAWQYSHFCVIFSIICIHVVLYLFANKNPPFLPTMHKFNYNCNDLDKVLGIRY